MKLYKLDYNDNIIELEVIKETPKTLVYTCSDSTISWTIRKSDIDKSLNNLYSLIATSPTRLKNIISEVFDTDIAYAKGRYEGLKEDKKRILDKLTNS